MSDGEAAYTAWPGQKAFVQLSAATHTSPYTDHPSSANFPTVLRTTTDFLSWALDGKRAALTDFRRSLAKLSATKLTGDDLGG